MSVKRKVTVPLGSSAMTLAASLRPERHDAYSAPIIVTSEAWARRKELQRTRLGDRLGARLVSVVPGQRQARGQPSPCRLKPYDPARRQGSILAFGLHW